MEFKETPINGVYIIKPNIFEDSRGYFSETFKQEEFEKNIGKINFIQDNESKSSYGVLRGLHFQKGEYAQAKLVRVIKGSVLDVVVDIRANSPTFGKYFSQELTEKNKLQLFAPRGMAHGYVVLQNDTVFSYKVDNVYSPQNEGGIVFNDPDLKIDWQVTSPQFLLSEKDMRLPLFKDIQF